MTMKESGNPYKVLVEISGGLDSSYVAYLLKQQGYDVDGIHFYHEMEKEDHNAKIEEIAKFLNIKIIFKNVKDEFKQLIKSIDIEMCHQKTPNICVMCAKTIKFGHLVEYANENGYDYIASGHYVKIIREGDDIHVAKADDKSRDQSYGFSVIPKKKLMKVITPLGDYIKTDIRKMAIEIGLPFLQKESRGLCFVKKTFKEFYEEYQPNLIQGNFIWNNKKLPHQGQQTYNIGQNIYFEKENLVVGRKKENGDILLTKKDEVWTNRFMIVDINYHREKENIDMTKMYQVKINYNGKVTDCYINIVNDKIEIITEEPLYAPVPQQIGTIYDDDIIVLGGYLE
jgi:tRNA-uridine 2-sulfurtransferase